MSGWMKWGMGLLFVLGIGSWLVWGREKNGEMRNPMGESFGEAQDKQKPYDKYSFSRLVERIDEQSEIEVVGDTFSYYTEGKRMTGAITLPDSKSPIDGWPVVVMIRGYVDKEVYTTGMGTSRAASYYASRGYVTLAPDFFGFGGSDEADEDSIGARLVKPANVLDLIASLESLEFVDTDRIYLWGHSNGGQISLSVAEILGRREELGLQGRTLPAQAGLKVRGVSLWAPVTRPFPYSILYYTYDWDDRGKELRRVIAEWEEDYEAEEYSVERYWDWIVMPIQIHQGTADEAVPVSWSDEVVEVWEELDLDVTYYRYPGADHNLRPSWETVVARDVRWFDALSRE